MLTGAKKCLILVVGGLGGLGGTKKRVVSEPGIEPGDSRWQRLMLPLHHSELGWRQFADPGNPISEFLAEPGPEPLTPKLGPEVGQLLRFGTNGEKIGI